MGIKYKIVLVPFPFDDGVQAKVRPAICLTESIGKHEHIVLGYISSQIPDEIEMTDLIIDSSSDGFRASGLLVSSVIRIHRMMTFPSKSIRREIGELPIHFHQELQKRIQQLFLS